MKSVIGLTGSIAAGKSTAAKILRQLGYAVFDADAVVATALAPGGAAENPLRARLPRVWRDGRIDKPTLRRAATDDDAVYETLEAILHPVVYDAAEGHIGNAGRALVLDIPLLFETRGDRLCDHVIVIDAAAPIRRARALRRPGMTPEILSRFEARQTPAAVKRRLADHVVRSGLDRRALRRQLISALHAPKKQRGRRLSPAWRHALGDRATRRTS